MIAPGGSETIQIYLVDKDKQVLLQSYDRLGQSALDHSKDKFLVQSCAVSRDFSKQYASTKDAQELSDALTSMWNAVASSGNTSIFNKKLHVRHVVSEGDGTTSASKLPVHHETPMANLEYMSQEQMVQEITTLRRKYDELVAFSVNLTAERDILNNTLEQTKRDLNREMASRAALENKGDGTGRGRRKGGSSLISTLFPLLIVAMAAFLMGVRMTKFKQTDFLDSIPIIGSMIGDDVVEDDVGSVSND